MKWSTTPSREPTKLHPSQALPPQLLALVYLRVALINGCPF